MKTYARTVYSFWHDPVFDTGFLTPRVNAILFTASLVLAIACFVYVGIMR